MTENSDKPVALEHIAALQKLKDSIPDYAGSDPRARHYQAIRAAIDAGIGALSRPTSAGQSEEPFAYYVERKLAAPVFIRRPSYVPSGEDYRVTPVYTHAALDLPAVQREAQGSAPVENAEPVEVTEVDRDLRSAIWGVLANALDGGGDFDCEANDRQVEEMLARHRAPIDLDARLREARREGLEEAATVADKHNRARMAAKASALERKQSREARDHETMAIEAIHIACAIRALSEGTEDDQE